MSAAAPTTSTTKRGAWKWISIVLVVTAVSGFALAFHRYRNREIAAKVADQPPALQLLHLDTFVVNLSDNDHTFLRIGIDLGVQSAPASSEKEKTDAEDVAIVRDTLVALLSSSTATELSSTAGRQTLKENMLKSLNARMPRLRVREIYFTEFLIQR